MLKVQIKGLVINLSYRYPNELEKHSIFKDIFCSQLYFCHYKSFFLVLLYFRANFGRSLDNWKLIRLSHMFIFQREELLSVHSCIPFVGNDHAFSLLCVPSNFVILSLQKRIIINNRNFHVLVQFMYQYNFEIEVYCNLKTAHSWLITKDICKFLYCWVERR